VYDRYGEIALANGCFGALAPNSGCWSMASAPVDEIIATLLTFGLSIPTAGLERSVRKAECRVPVYGRQTPNCATFFLRIKLRQLN